jgi:hypothetical protein
VSSAARRTGLVEVCINSNINININSNRVGRVALESTSAPFQGAATPSQLPARSVIRMPRMSVIQSQRAQQEGPVVA